MRQQKITDISRNLIEKILESNHPSTVGQLARQVLSNGVVEEDDFAAAVEEMSRDGSIVLESPSYDIETALDYLFTPTLSGWMWLTILGVLMAIMSIFVIPDVFPVSVMRWVLGSVFVLYLPGYTLMQFLFPKGGEVDSLERFAISVGVSLAVVSLIGLLLNFSPWGIRLGPIVVSLSIFTFVFGIGAATRKYDQLRKNTFQPPVV